MKKIYYSTVFILLSFYSTGQSWLWGRQMKDSDGALVCGFPIGSSSSSSGSDNNAYTTGSFSGTLYFNTDTLVGGFDDFYLAKFAPSGTLKWAVKSIDSSNLSSATGYAVTGDRNGNVYVTGSYSGTVQFGTLTLRCAPADIVLFLIKYDSNGNALWVREAGSRTLHDNCRGVSIAVDKADNVVLSGFFSDTISLGANTLINGQYNLSAFLLVKYDANGNVLWTTQSHQGINSTVGGTAITIDNMNNIFVTSSFMDTVTFGALTLYNPSGAYNTFLVKYSSSGTALWARQSTHLTSNNIENSNSVTTDNAGNAYITGYFNDSAHFGNCFLIATGPYDLFLTKYDKNGNVIWAKQASTPNWEGLALASDKYNHIYIGGKSMYYSPSFTFGSLTVNCNKPYEAGLIFTVDTSGTPICGSTLPNLDKYPSISADSTGNYIYIGGLFADDTIICGPDTLINNYPNNGSGGNSIFIGRWQSCYENATGINEVNSKDNAQINLYPNPSNGEFFVFCHSDQPAVGEESLPIIKVYNVLGEQVFTKILRFDSNKDAQGGNSINLTSQPDGIYLYRVSNENGNLLGSGKLIIQK